MCLRPIPWEAVVLAFEMASMPVWPAFISLAAVTPPGVSIVPMPLVLADFALSIVFSITVCIVLVRERAVVSPLTKVMVIYVATWILASLFGFDLITGLLMTLALVMTTVFYHAISAWYERPYVARAMYATFLLTGTCVAVLGIGMVVLRQPEALYVLVHGRATSTFLVPGEFAAYLLLLITSALGVVVTDRTILRPLGIAALLCGIVALIMTYSRAAWLGATVGATFFLYARSRLIGKRKVHAALAGACPIVAMLFAGVLLFHRNHNPSEDFVRLPIWQAGLRAIELFPLTGTGPGAFRHVYPLLRPIAGERAAFHVHNVPLTVFAETGLIGFSAFCALWFSFIVLLRAEIRRASASHALLALALATGFVATLAQGLLDFTQVVVLGCWLPFMALTVQAARRGIPHS
jgi:O-antigen ligase